MERSAALKLATSVAALALGCGALVGVAHGVPLPARLWEPPSRVLAFRDGSVAHATTAADGRWRLPVALERVDPAYVAALIRLEDKRFEMHWGVDPFAMARAALLNLTHGRRVSGGSTLTLQLVRLLEPRPRTWTSKAIEALRAVQLELRLSKREILTAYLQFVPFGRNLEGVEAGAVSYFGHRADHLDGAEVATLLAVPQNPNRRHPAPERKGILRSIRNEILDKLARFGALPAGATLEVLRGHAVPAALLRFPRRAPHAAAWLAARSPDRYFLLSTLDEAVQTAAERALRAAASELRARGVHNGAAVVLDHRSFEVRAAVGNFDFGDTEHGGEIVGFSVPRSPGSALKPFLYAMAIEEGLTGPEELMADVPVAYGTYAPRNFDGQFNGLVRLEEALSRSLNLPFVELLRRVGVERFLGRLESMGVLSFKREAGHYGLSAAVGGLELTATELAALYAALAHRGLSQPVRWLREASRPEAVSVLTPGAAWLTRRALSLRDRPDFPARKQWGQVPSHIHWKTGTSFGHRDAWAVGSGPELTVAVWLGNFDNTASPALVGADAAGPVLFDLLEAVADKAKPYPGDPQPPDLHQIELCALSGQLPGPGCQERKHGWVLRSHVPTKACDLHRRLEIDLETGQALTPACRAGRRSESRNFVVLPAPVRRWMRDTHRPFDESPPYAPGCDTDSVGPPEIVSPAPGQIALLIPGVPPAKQEMPLEASAGSPSESLSWFVDGSFLGTVRAEERLWWTPSPGFHEVVVSNGAGRSSRRALEVRLRPY